MEMPASSTTALLAACQEGPLTRTRRVCGAAGGAAVVAASSRVLVVRLPGGDAKGYEYRVVQLAAALVAQADISAIPGFSFRTHSLVRPDLFTFRDARTLYFVDGWRLVKLVAAREDFTPSSATGGQSKKEEKESKTESSESMSDSSVRESRFRLGRLLRKAGGADGCYELSLRWVDNGAFLRLKMGRRKNAQTSLKYFELREKTADSFTCELVSFGMAYPEGDRCIRAPLGNGEVDAQAMTSGWFGIHHDDGIAVPIRAKRMARGNVAGVVLDDHLICKTDGVAIAVYDMAREDGAEREKNNPLQAINLFKECGIKAAPGVRRRVRAIACSGNAVFITAGEHIIQSEWRCPRPIRSVSSTSLSTARSASSISAIMALSVTTVGTVLSESSSLRSVTVIGDDDEKSSISGESSDKSSTSSGGWEMVVESEEEDGDVEKEEEGENGKGKEEEMEKPAEKEQEEEKKAERDDNSVEQSDEDLELIDEIAMTSREMCGMDISVTDKEYHQGHEEEDTDNGCRLA